MRNTDCAGGMVSSVVDPDVALFVERLNVAYASHDLSNAEPAARRRIAEEVRAPWRSGGPAMASTREFKLGKTRLRLHIPVTAAVLPVMLYVHGGGWTLFSIDTHDRLMREYAARANMAVLGIDYSLSPESKFPIALLELNEALRWINANGAAQGLDRGHVFIGGDSAGANLSVATCLWRRAAGLPPLTGMILNYGAFDPAPMGSYRRYAGPQYNLEVAEMNEFWLNYVEDVSQFDDPLVSPLRADLHGLPPAVVSIPECDILADSNWAFVRKLRTAGVEVEAHGYRGATHSFLEAVSIAPIAARALDDQAAWMRARVKSGRSGD